MLEQVRAFFSYEEIWSSCFIIATFHINHLPSQEDWSSILLSLIRQLFSVRVFDQSPVRVGLWGGLAALVLSVPLVRGSLCKTNFDLSSMERGELCHDQFVGLLLAGQTRSIGAARSNVEVRCTDIGLESGVW